MCFGLICQVFVITALGQSAPTERPERDTSAAIERLLALAPSDAAAILTVENLADQLDRGAEHPLFRAVSRMLDARGWNESDDRRQLERSRAEIEAVLGLTLDSLARDILGDALVLALRLPPEGGEPAGLLLVQAPDPVKLKAAVGALNRAEKAGGSLDEIATRSRGELGYQVRTFRDGRPSDAFALLDGGLFIWSNSEALLKDVLARVASAKVADQAAPNWLTALRADLPQSVPISLYLNTPALAPLVEKDDSARTLIKTLDGVGLALQFEAGSVELLAVEHLAAGIAPAPAPGSRSNGARLAARLRGPVFAVAAGSIDVLWAYQRLLDIALEGDPERRELIQTTLTGLLGGADVVRDILPRVGPGLLLSWAPYVAPVDARADEPIRVPALLAAVELDNQPALHAAITNFVRTALALAALDPKQQAAGARLEMVDSDGLSLIRYRQTGFSLVAHVGVDFLVISTDENRLIDFARTDASQDVAPAWLDAKVAEADQLVWLNLKEIRGWVSDHRGSILDRMTAEANGDRTGATAELDQFASLLTLFETASLISQTDDDGRVWRQRLQLNLSAP